MKPFRVRYTPEASAIIQKLHPTVKAAVGAGISDIAGAPLSGRALQFELAGFRSFRVGRYRVIHRINEDDPCIEIHYVGPRRDVYEGFRDLLWSRRPPR